MKGRDAELDVSAARLADPDTFWGPGGRTIFNHPPRAVYVHVPFCRHRCGYCNFTLVARRDDLIPRYLAAIAREIEWLAGPAVVSTVYCGGGTPTQLDLQSLDRLLSALADSFPMEADGEWTVEANPADVTDELAELLRSRGVTRVSLGVQSFREPKLRLLERDHTGREAVLAIERLARCGVQVAADLIFGLPGETLANWLDDLGRLTELPVNHVSTYGLTWEKGTSFWSRRQRGELVPIDEGLECDLYLAAIDWLGERGWEQYEVSNFARPGARSRHNQAYWRGESYWGLGPGAARYVAGCRAVHHRSTTTYLQRVLEGGVVDESSEVLTAAERARELLVFSLRMRDGVDLAEFADRTGWTVESLVGSVWQRYLDQGWLELVDGHGRLTRRGLVISDALWPDLL